MALSVPVGSEAGFSGIVSVLESGVEPPEAVREAVQAAREALTEAIAETDDDLTLKYLEGEPLTADELTQGLKRGVASGAIVPVLVGASPSGIGTKELLDAIVDYMPSPADRPPVSATASSGEEELSCDSAD